MWGHLLVLPVIHLRLPMATVTVPDATIAYDRHINNYLDTAGIVLLVYDYLLTLEWEVAYIWTPKRTRTSSWYLFVRYFALCINTAALTQLDFGNFGSESCLRLKNAYSLLIVAQELLVGCTLILRVLAMYFFDKRVIFTLAITAIVAVSVAAWCVIPRSPAPVYETSVPGCHTPASHLQQIRLAGAW
ncbi:hypothetical protein FB451DRAFT_1370358, partial [Mycena latifolia]